MYINISLDKEAREKSLSIKVQENKNLKNGASVGQEMVDAFIKEYHVSTLGDKTTLVRAILQNDFEIIKASGCVSKENYSEEMGAQINKKKINDEVWAFLGFMLQTAMMADNTKE